jgi:hypothetical protein
LVCISHYGIGRIGGAVTIIAIVAVAGGVGIFLGSGDTSTATSETKPSASSTTYTVVSTTSTDQISSSNSTTLSSIGGPTDCVFSPPGPLVREGGTPITTASTLYFTGCLTAGASGVYFVGIGNPNGVVMMGVIKTQYSSQIEIAGAVVGNLTAGRAGGIVVSMNDTTVVPLPDVLLLGYWGYAVTVMNESRQNDTVTIDLTFIDAGVFGA